MPDKDRVIYLIDMDGCFASIEKLYHPELKRGPNGRLRGSSQSPGGSYPRQEQLAKGKGVKTAETINSAR